MNLIRASTFARKHFDPQDAPDTRTLRDAVLRGPNVEGGLQGRILGSIVYIDEDWFLHQSANPLTNKIQHAANA